MGKDNSQDGKDGIVVKEHMEKNEKTPDINAGLFNGGGEHQASCIAYNEEEIENQNHGNFVDHTIKIQTMRGRIQENAL